MARIYNKYSMFSLVALLFIFPYGQDIQKTYREIIVQSGDTIIKANIRINPTNEGKILDIKNVYYWYAEEKIHKSKGNFSGLLLEGPFEAWLCKMLIIKGHYVSGLKNGLWFYWYNNGQLKKVETFYKGEKTDSEIFYDKRGTVKSVKNYKHGALYGPQYQFFSDSIIVNTYKNGRFIKRELINRNSVSYDKYKNKYK